MLQSIARPARIPGALTVAALLVLLGLLVLGFGLGQTLAIGQGEGAAQLAMFQDFLQDARLAAGFICH